MIRGMRARKSMAMIGLGGGGGGVKYKNSLYIPINIFRQRVLTKIMPDSNSSSIFEIRQ